MEIRVLPIHSMTRITGIINLFLCKHNESVHYHKFYFSVKAFLPKVFWDHHISSEVDKEHCQLQGTHHSAQDHITHVVETCTKLLTRDGIYYDVTVSLIPKTRIKCF